MRFKKNHTFFHRLPPVNIKLSRYIPLSNVRGRFDKNVVANFEKVHVPLSLDSLCFVFFFFLLLFLFLFTGRRSFSLLNPPLFFSVHLLREKEKDKRQKRKKRKEKTTRLNETSGKAVKDGFQYSYQERGHISLNRMRWARTTVPAA
jgi:hypothetical protein